MLFRSRYNSAIAIGSINANVFRFTSGPPTYRVNGIISHRMGSLIPEEGAPARYLEMYFLGDPLMTMQHGDYFQDLDQAIVEQLRILQATHNVLLRNMLTVYNSVNNDNNEMDIEGGLGASNVVLTIRQPDISHVRRTTNVPSIVEGAAFIPDMLYDNDEAHMIMMFRMISNIATDNSTS